MHSNLDRLCYSYSQYCRLRAQLVSQQKHSMRQIHRAKERLFVNYAGQTMPIINPDTGEDFIGTKHFVSLRIIVATFYPLSDGSSMQNHRITRTNFRSCSMCLSRSQALLYSCTNRCDIVIFRFPLSKD